MENEINLKLTTVKVKAQSRKLKLGYNYKIGMTKKDIKDTLQEIKSELKFHGFTMEIGKIENGTVFIHNIKEDVSMNLFIEEYEFL